MKLLIVFLLGISVSLKAEVTPPEAEALRLFEAAGARITKNEEGHAVKLFSGGKPPHSVDDLQQIKHMRHLEQLALNSPQAGNDDWSFLHELPRLRSLTIWHAGKIQSLEPFSDLAIESLTVGGCMGLRDLNKETPEKQRDAVLSLKGLPQLKSANLYHSPTVSTNVHLKHLLDEFPRLTDVKFDVATPRGFESGITPQGLEHLQKLPVEVLSIENASMFHEEHITALAGIKTLRALLLDFRRLEFDADPLVKTMKKLRPDVEVVVAEQGASGPPRRSQK